MIWFKGHQIFFIHVHFNITHDQRFCTSMLYVGKQFLPIQTKKEKNIWENFSVLKLIFRHRSDEENQQIKKDLFLQFFATHFGWFWKLL
jgi:hypothetical protein